MSIVPANNSIELLKYDLADWTWRNKMKIANNPEREQPGMVQPCFSGPVAA